jgi:hypothetical protein
MDVGQLSPASRATVAHGTGKYAGPLLGGSFCKRRRPMAKPQFVELLSRNSTFNAALMNQLIPGARGSAMVGADLGGRN